MCLLLFLLHFCKALSYNFHCIIAANCSLNFQLTLFWRRFKAAPLVDLHIVIQMRTLFSCNDKMRISACEGSANIFFSGPTCMLVCWVQISHDTKRNKIQRTMKKTLSATSENEMFPTWKEVHMMNVAITVNRQVNKRRTWRMVQIDVRDRCYEGANRQIARQVSQRRHWQIYCKG